MQMVTQLDNRDNNSNLNKNIVVSLDDKYVGVVFEETIDKILVVSEESESHDRFEIPKCKVIMWSPSVDRKMILDLEYAEILKYKTRLLTV